HLALAAGDLPFLPEAVGERDFPSEAGAFQRAAVPVRDEGGGSETAAGGERLAGWAVEADEVGAGEIRDAHAGDEAVVAELLGGAVVIEQAVVLPLDVGELGVDVAADLGVPAQLAGEELEAVGDVLVAPARAEAAVLAVQQRRGFL